MTAQYRFALLDPRPIPAAQEINEAIFALGPVYGVEVTVPALAARCTANIDPQHTGGNASRAAIEMALTEALPPDGAILATIRGDIDSVGAMAVFAARAADDSFGFSQFLAKSERIAQVATADKFERGGWPGRQPLPTKKDPWPTASAAASDTRPLAAIAAAVADFKVPIGDRVSAMERWLLEGKEPEQYRQRVEAERTEMIAAIERGDIKVQAVADGRIAVVESTHRAATSVGYSMAPVVVALNPSFRLGGGEPHRKFTICAFEPKFADVKSALAELNELEPGWGGSPTIGGSPQGVSSTLTTDQVIEVVARHLR